MMISLGLDYESLSRMRRTSARTPRHRCTNCDKETLAHIDGLCIACHDATEIQTALNPLFLIAGREKLGRSPVSQADRSQKNQPADRDPNAGQRLELKAWSEGIKLGKEHSGDPWRMAKAIGATVQLGDGATMRAKGCDGWSLILERPFIMLADDLTSTEKPIVLAHELGHWVLGKVEGVSKFIEERACDEFGKHFMAQRPEQPWEMAARLRREGEERAQRQARYAALLRR